MTEPGPTERGAGDGPGRRMGLDRVLLAIVVALWAVTLWILLTPEPAGALGAAHPELAGMRLGGPGLARHGTVLWAGWAFGAAGIIFYVALMAFGTREGAYRRAVARWLGVGLLAFEGAWTWLVLAYRDDMIDGPAGLVLGFPLPTAIMLYVLFPASLIFAVAYVVGFGRWVLSEEDEAAYAALLAETREHDAPASDGKAGGGVG